MRNHLIILYPYFAIAKLRLKYTIEKLEMRYPGICNSSVKFHLPCLCAEDQQHFGEELDRGAELDERLERSRSVPLLDALYADHHTGCVGHDPDNPDRYRKAVKGRQHRFAV